jgi:glycosyltransferase involved in cell wall biosynthesis
MVSVILPAYNAAASLTAAVESIRNQTFTDWELILIDDGSTDQTFAVAQQLFAREPRLKILSQPRSGIVQALNFGLCQACGRFIARMDADDLSHPERLSRQITMLEQQPDLGLVSCQVAYGGNREINTGYALHVDWINTLTTPEAIQLNRFVESPLAHPSVVFRRDLVGRHGSYADGAFPEDYELWLRWLDAGVRMAKSPETLLTWNDPPERLSRKDPRYDFEAFYAVKARYLARAVEANRQDRRVWIWGAGRPTRVRAEQLTPYGINIAGYIDIDPRKSGRILHGRPIVSPQQLPSASEAFIVGYVAKRGARELIRASLTQASYVEGQDFLMAA